MGRSDKGDRSQDRVIRITQSRRVRRGAREAATYLVYGATAAELASA